jgi:hypothetical protein
METIVKRSAHLTREMIYSSLINESPVLIGKTNYDTFKVVYEHPTKRSEDLYIILQFDESENILIITAYTHSADRRLRPHE